MKLASLLLLAVLLLTMSVCLAGDAGMGAIAHTTPIGLCLAMAAASLAVALLARPLATGRVLSRPSVHLHSVALRTLDPPPKFRSLA